MKTDNEFRHRLSEDRRYLFIDHDTLPWLTLDRERALALLAAIQAELPEMAFDSESQLALPRRNGAHYLHTDGWYRLTPPSEKGAP